MNVLAADGGVKGQVELPKPVFGRDGARSLVWEAARAFLASQRQGNVGVKTRAQVSGTGRKPYRQKGIGRARHGSRRSPLFVGGGTCFGPQPRDYSVRIPRKKRRQALCVALSVRRADGGLKVVEDFELGEPKTKQLVRILATFGFSGSVLLLVDKVSDNMKRASRNVPWLDVMPAEQANTYTVLSHRHVVFTERGLSRFISAVGESDD